MPPDRDVIEVIRDGAFLRYIFTNPTLVMRLLVPFVLSRVIAEARPGVYEPLTADNVPMFLDQDGEFSSPIWAAENPLEQDLKNRNKNHANRS